MGFLAPIVPALPGIATGVAAAFGAKKQSDAAKAQQQSTDEALAWQKQQAQAAQEMYKQQYMDWLWGRNQLLQRYGFDAPPMPQFGGGAATGIPSTPQTAPVGTMMQGGAAPSVTAPQAFTPFRTPNISVKAAPEFGIGAGASLGKFLMR